MYKFIFLAITLSFSNISATAAILQTKNTLKNKHSKVFYSPTHLSFFSTSFIQAAIINHQRLDDLIKVENENHGLKTFCFYRNPFDKIPLTIVLISNLKQLCFQDILTSKPTFISINQLTIPKAPPFTK